MQLIQKANKKCEDKYALLFFSMVPTLFNINEKLDVKHFIIQAF